MRVRKIGLSFNLYSGSLLIYILYFYKTDRIYEFNSCIIGTCEENIELTAVFQYSINFPLYVVVCYANMRCNKRIIQ